jgi:hypothetical protein
LRGEGGQVVASRLAYWQVVTQKESQANKGIKQTNRQGQIVSRGSTVVLGRARVTEPQGKLLLRSYHLKFILRL